jgi:hypothetical protein
MGDGFISKTENEMNYREGTGISVSLLLMGMAFGMVFFAPQAAAASTPVTLGTAAPFAVLAYSGITNTGITTITGNVGSVPTPSETGFGTVSITGTNYLAGAPTSAQTDLSSAMVQANGYAPAIMLTSLNSQTLDAGVYTSASTTFTLSGTLVLNGQGDTNSVWILQAPSTGTSLDTAAASGATVVLENGADSCNVFWVLGGTATLGTSTTFIGTIMAGASVTLGTGTTVRGAVLASTGDVTMQGNTISTACVTAPITTTATSSLPSTTTTPTTTAASTQQETSCAFVNGWYTNSATGQIVYFYSVPYAIAVQLVDNNTPAGIDGDCASAPTTTTTTAATTTTATPPCVYLTVISETTNGTILTGESNDIWNNQSQPQPTTSCVPPNTAETVGVFDSGHYMFSHWLDTGSALRFRSFAIASNTTFTAIYTNTDMPTPPTDSIISVSAANSTGASMAGFYTTLWQNGILIQSCFTSCSFTVNGAQTYQVAVADFGSFSFSHWTDGTTNRFHTMAVGDTASTISIVAVYAAPPATAAPETAVPRSMAQVLAIQVAPSTASQRGPAWTVVEVGVILAALALLIGATFRRSTLK